jgi:hypothetical protein
MINTDLAFKIRINILTLFMVMSTAYSQGIEDFIVSGSYEKKPVVEIINELEEQIPVVFHYNNELIAGLNFSGTISEIPLPELVKRLVQNSELSFITVQNHIFLVPRLELLTILGKLNGKEIHSVVEREHAILIGNPEDAGKYRQVRISGIIRDGKDGTTLVGTTVEVANTSQYAVSDRNGEFHLDVSPGRQTLRARSLGYETTQIEIHALGPGKLDIDVFETTHQLAEVMIYASRPDHNVRSNQMSIIELDARNIKQLPVMTGERDILKSLTMAPGVVSGGEFGSGINVRGGGEDQNLYLIEGAPLFNTSHAMGLLSVLNPDMVTSVSLYKGHIPPDYGERVSSVMNIGMRDHSIDKPTVKGGIGIFSSRIQVESPVFHERVTLKLGARTSYSDYLLQLLNDYNIMNSSMKFYDLSGVLEFNFKNNPITVMGYRSDNFFRYTDIFSNQYENTLGSVSWSHIFSPDFTSNIALAYSKYSVERSEISNPLFANRVNSSNEYINAKFSLGYEGFDRQAIDAGGQAIIYNLLPGARIPLEGSSSSEFRTEPEHGREISLFTNYSLELSPKTSIQAGIRLTRYQFLGPHTKYQYLDGGPRLHIYITDSIQYAAGDIISQYNSLEPRLSFRQMINEESSVKFSYNRNTQFIFLMSYTSISTPEDFWKLSDPYLKPIRANQFAAGYYRNFNQNMYEASVEAYYKQLDDIMDYRDNAQLSLNNHLETELLPAIGYNYGVELLIKKNTGVISGNIGYTYSRSLRKTLSDDVRNQINNNELYSSSYDKPNDISINLQYNHNRRVRIGAILNYSSGRPITLPEYVYRIGTSQHVYYSDRNKYRLPPYHRLDISLSVNESIRRKRAWKGSWTFSLLNVYARKNAYSVFYKHETPSEHNNFNSFSLYKLSMIGIPLPTLTYNFIF